MNKYLKEIVQHFESCSLKAYLDTDDIATIGWGSIYYSKRNGEPVKMGDVITHKEADDEFEADIKEFTDAVRPLVKVPLNERQEAALISLAYNIGMGNFKSSTLLKKLNKGDYEGAALEFRWWRKDAGKVVKGLVRRRLSEENLFRGDVCYIIQKLRPDWREYYYGGK